MAARSAPIYSQKPQAAWWQRFQRLAEQRVCECNALAGERLWISAAPIDSAVSWAVYSASNPADSVSCSVDEEAGFLMCKPGPAVCGETVVFECSNGSVDVVRCGEVELSMEEAVSLMLDRLAWPDEPCDEAQADYSEAK
jgi:hypothetical protein